ncbi:MAG: glycosyltransferase [Deltaproteobacteria bacterium]|nr:glycosyltransferase [Deltaproteobacteria bacterium]
MNNTPVNGRRRLRVLHVGKYYPPHAGGIETHLSALCGGLRRLVDVEIMVASEDGTSREEAVDGVPVTRVATMMDVASAPVCPGMVRGIRATQADIIHLHLPNPAAVLAYLASGRNLPLVASYHSDIVRQKVLGRGFAPFLQRFLRRCVAIIVASPNYLDSSPVLQRHRQRCRVIPYGIAGADFRESDERQVDGIRQRYGSPLILSVGRLVYYKGLPYLIRAMGQVGARLLIVGDGPLRAILEQEAAALEVSDRVIFLGPVPDVRPYYHAADVFVLASVARSEAFGIVQLEAMASGVPVVNTWLKSGVPFVSRNGRTGLTVPPEDPDALADAINLLLADKELRARCGAAARRRVQEDFSVETMVERTAQLYREVLAAQPACDASAVVES